MRVEQEIIEKKLATYVHEEKDKTEGYTYFLTQLEGMEKERDNTFNRPVASAKPGIGSLVVVFKKLVRRMVAWYNNPFAQQQAAFNTATVQSTAYLGDALKRLQEENHLLAQRVTELEEAVWLLKNENGGPGK